MTRFRSIAVAAALFAVAVSQRIAIADILDQVPANAAAIARVRNIDKINATLAKLMAANGAANGVAYNAPLDTYFQSTHLTKGVDRAGDLAYVACGKSIDFNNTDQQMVILLSITDYQAFLGNFTNPQTGADGITTVNDTNFNQKGYVAHWGSFAAMSVNKDLLAKKPPGIKLQGPAADEFAKRDLALYIPMDQVRDAALAKFKGDEEETAEEMMGELPQLPTAFKPLQDVLDQMLIAQVRQFLEDDNAVAMTLDVTDAGVLYSGVADFKPGSNLAKFSASLTSSNNSALLAGLPNEKYFVLGGAAFSPEMKQQIIATLIDPIAAHLDKTDPASKSIAELLDGLRGIFTSTDGVAGGVVGKPGDKSPYRIVRVASGQAPAIEKSYVDVWAGLTDLVLPPRSATTRPNASIVFKPRSATVDDVPFDLFSLKPASADGGPASQPADTIFGADQLTGWIAAASPRSMLIVTGTAPADPLLHDSIVAAKSAKDTLSADKAIAATAAHLPPSRPWEMFVYLERFDATYDGGGGAPPDEQPVGASFAGNGPTLRVDVFMPVSELKYFIPFGASADIGTTTAPATEPGQ